MTLPTPNRLLARWKNPIEECLRRLLPADDPSGLAEAMGYSLMAGGKRIRPVLALGAYEACGGPDATVILEPACALEMFHTYSLIHDDLPAMDDDDLRRGRPTSHKVFGEAMAILAGDALQTLGAEVLVSFPPGEIFAARRGEVCRAIFGALGWSGMAGGQALDLKGEGRSDLEVADLVAIHRRKTGALLEASLMTGGILAGGNAESLSALRRFGENLGLAFQVVDDILDVTATSEELGKTAGKDSRQKKATFPSLLGLEGARAEARRLHAESLRALEPLGERGVKLRELAQFLLARTN